MKRLWVSLLAGVLLVASLQDAQASTFGSAVGSMVAANAAANGFSSSDPRIAATADAIGKAAAGYAAGAAAAFGGAVADVPWAAVAGAAGIAAFMAAPVTLGGDDSPMWQYNPDGTVSLPGSGQEVGGTGTDGSLKTGDFAPLADGSRFYYPGSLSDCSNGCGGDIYAAAQAYAQYRESRSSTLVFTIQSCGTTSCSGTENGTSISVAIDSSNNYTGPACSSGMNTGGTCTAWVDPNGASTPASPDTPASAVAAIPPSVLPEPLDPTMAADTADALWADAASADGYQGLPYPVGSPITPAQAGAVESADAAAWPTVGDFAAGAGTSAAGGSTTTASGSTATPFDTSIPASSAAGASSVPVATNPGTGAEVNLGPDPGVGSPSLEQTPTAQMILAPILGMLPDLKTYGVPSHTSECPKPSFTLWDQSFTFDAQCTLIEQNRAAIYGAFVLMWSLVALFVVLTA